METLTVEYQVKDYVLSRYGLPPQRFERTEYATVPCIAVRAQRYRNHGTAQIDYLALTSAGDWLRFKKGDNRCVKLPTAAQLTWTGYKNDGYSAHRRYDSYTDVTDAYAI